MDENLKTVLTRFKSLLKRKLPVHEVILFGSQARGDAESESDVDLIVIIDRELSEADREYISDCAWEIGFARGLVLSPVNFSWEEWESGPEKMSLLGRSVRSEGISI